MAQQTYTPLSNMEVSSFCSQMAMILKSGISSIEGISIMQEETKGSEEQELLTIMQHSLQETGSFYDALVSAKVFPDYMLQMVFIGEQTGKLDEVMNALSLHYEREASITQTIKNAVTYPLIMIFMMFLVILVLITKVMPIFNQVFKQLGSEMTGFSKAILDFGTAVNRYSAVLLVIVIALLIFLLFITKTRKGRMWFGKFCASLTWTKGLSEKLSACRFASGMSLTLSSGISPLECLNMVSGLSDNVSFQKKLSECKSLVEGGEDLSKALVDTKIFSGIYARITAIGAKTGVLDEVMNDIAVKYQEEIDQKFAGMLAIIEPTLVIILSIIVGLILLSVMLPLMGIMSGL